MKSKIIVQEIEGKRVHLRRTKDSFRVVKPYKNEDGSFNWFNFLTGGSWTNLIATTIFVIVFLGLLFEYSKNLNSLLDCFRVPGLLEGCIEFYGNESVRLIP